MKAFQGHPAEWNALIGQLPHPHLLQTWEWAQVKAKYGWQPMPFVWESPDGGRKPPAAAAMVLKRVLPAGGFARKMCILYSSKGPLLDWTEAALRGRVLADLQALARRTGAIFVKTDPEVLLGTGIPGNAESIEAETGPVVRSELARGGWQFSQDQIQFRNSVLIDLSPSEDEMLDRMKQKTRYNVRLAEKKGVTVRIGTKADLPLLYKMYAETSVRDGFVIREEGYYQTVWQTFMRPPEAGGQPSAEPLIAEVEGQPVAAVFLFYFAGRAYYLYGMSRQAHRERMPNHLLQWQAMRRAKASGCAVYDLWGAPDAFDESDSMWGVFRFKVGLGGEVVRTLGAWDYTPSPALYRVYTQIIPRLLDVMRSRGQRRTRQSMG
ncbi:MAG: peptidoglycan bridge formation glycyltransferase FemA/FemB family protein [Anaerolineales bacterium]|nr:peptidoglycan bridge formation glycyltransferase FemA/FemB family protein [Anaerolineales bacterium]